MSKSPKITTTTALEKWIPEPRQQANCGDNLYARAKKKGKVLRYRHGKYILERGLLGPTKYNWGKRIVVAMDNVPCVWKFGLNH